jgi:phosphatidylethanolamine-binding protein (PEBP) family uncharacterized protein
MLRFVPAFIGRVLRRLRAGTTKLTGNRPELGGVPSSLTVSSDAFRDGEALPVRFTADGEGISPPLRWSGVPASSSALILLIEDADSPTLRPLVHAIAPSLLAGDASLAEGALPSPGHSGSGYRMGRNSFFRANYQPPDPPKGHGPHRYAYQLFAVSRSVKGWAPGRRRLLADLRAHATAKGMLIGTYERT